MLVLFVLVGMVLPRLHAQGVAYTPSPLDPTRGLTASAATAHTPLPEEYIWTADDITVRRADRSKYSWSRTDLRVAPHLFRTHFKVNKLPHVATVYIAGPREAHVWLNGRLLGEFYTDPDQPINFRVFHADASKALKLGDNVLAIEAVRGRGVVSGAGPLTTQHLAYGEVLVAKVVPAAFGAETAALAISDASWRSTSTFTQGWEKPGFDDTKWLPVGSLGPVESNVDLMQWSADAGMYGWPGYMGMSPHLRTYTLPAAAVSHVFTGAASFKHLDALTTASGKDTFSVTYPKTPMTDADSPQIVLDFGREVAGRLYVESASAQDATLSIAYGESELEALATGLTSGQQGGNYLGTNLLDVAANGVARGPKSAFRYVRIRFLRGAPVTSFKAIRLEGVYEPVQYVGSFESSDPLLNRIWETGAYTVHLCMQDGLWDAPKRDRGRWVGDIDVEGRVISTAFGDSELLKDTLRRLAEATLASQHVNGIASYSALWITSLDNMYQHGGDKAFLASQRGALLQILARLDQDMGPDGLLTASSKGWGFVDWAPGMYGATAEARIGTNLQYLRGYEAGVRLLEALGDPAAEGYATKLATMKQAARGAYVDAATGTVGRTWQLNTLAVLDGLAPQEAVWNEVLGHVKQDSPTDQVISPYFGAYLLDAMAEIGHRREALEWIRTYWGGMLAEGATSLWESYDLRWPKTNPHLSLQADGTSGYFVSLAHGWSAGPTAWLAENVLGVVPTAPGYAKVAIRPELLGLKYAKGTVPTPHGAIVVSVDESTGLVLDLPADVEATVQFGGRTEVYRHAGHYAIPAK